MLPEKIHYKGGFSNFFIKYPYYCRETVSLHLKHHNWLLHWTLFGQIFDSASLTTQQQNRCNNQITGTATEAFILQNQLQY